MSFFKKLADDFDGLGLGDKKRDERYSSSRDYPAPQHYGGGPSQADYPSYPGPGHSSHHYQQQQQQQQPPPPPSSSSPGYASRDGPSDYGAPPPPPSSDSPPSYNPPSDKPRIPDGWAPQWDAHYARWYYVEQATGRAQWEAPGYSASQGHEHDARGYPTEHGGGYAGGHESYGGGHGGYGEQGYGGGHGGDGYSDKKKSSSSGMLLGVAGGLAAGAVGGALLHEALDDSDDEHRAAPAYEQSYDAPPPPVLPTHDVYGDEVDSSDRESVQEAREDYEEALADAQDSDASSSDQEELEEAREEYQEEYEEAYYDD